ncbi:MAG: hypothetical protein IPM79_07095 [Polyangiaceae bacterium]|jgi:hypothetical protein|nr:hypothetical protein [Polyangiaceae bacterium]MBK8937403.1 hypothetical protein [Polyangiaceae bacterium]
MPAEESGVKHLLLEVPDHVSQSGDEDRTMTTFLRMGTFDPNAPGMSLIEEAEEEGFLDDDRDRGNNPAGFPAGSPGHTLTKAERAQETSRLRTRGGWQDHSDGNRISTTLGDKVEIIRGNYKLLVLGRQDALAKAAGWDVSGGKVEDQDVYPPSYTEWKWVQTWNGTWKLTEMIERTDVHSITHGNLKEEFYGDKMESIVGSADESVNVEHSVESSKKKRPEIVEKTFAKSITSETGSAAVPVPTITDTTFAGAITETTTAAAVTETATLGASTSTTTVTGELKDTTTASKLVESGTFGSTDSTTTVTGQLKETTTAGSSNSTTTITGTQTETATIGAIVSSQAVGAVNNFATSATQIDVSLIGANLGVIICGAMLDVELSVLRGEVKAGVAFLEIEAAVIYVEVFLGIKMEISIAKSIKYDTSNSEFVLEKKVGIGL